jgi:hypothetical protein
MYEVFAVELSIADTSADLATESICSKPVDGQVESLRSDPDTDSLTRRAADQSYSGQ